MKFLISLELGIEISPWIDSRRKEMQKKDIYLICVTMIICSIIIGLIVGSFILHGLEDIAAIINHGLLTINQSIHWQKLFIFTFYESNRSEQSIGPICFFGIILLIIKCVCCWRSLIAVACLKERKLEVIKISFSF